MSCCKMDEMVHCFRYLHGWALRKIVRAGVTGIVAAHTASGEIPLIAVVAHDIRCLFYESCGGYSD
jgi:hypothetical protein